MLWIYNIVIWASYGLCTFLALRQALHMFQLNGYQDLSYGNYLKTHKKTYWNAKRLVPCGLMLLGGMSINAQPILFAAGAGLWVLVNRPQKAKKPLVYTPRVKRLLICAAVVTVAWASLTDYITTVLLISGIMLQSGLVVMLGVLYTSLALALFILFQHRLIMLYNDLMSPIEKAINNHYINDARKILASRPDLRVIGITGSYGKTSTKYFLQRLLSTRYNVYMTPGNYNTTLGVTRAVREGLRPTHEIFLCEMGARHVGDIKEVCDLAKPTMGVITSVGPQHLETFGSQERVLRGKLELAQAVKGKGPVFLNFDSQLLQEAKLGQEVISYGINGEDYTMSNLSIDENGSRFSVKAPDGTRQEFSTRLLGHANVQNICGAIAVAHHLGIPMTVLAPAVRQLESVPHRLQLIRQTGLTVIDDAYNSNPAGAKNALETLALCRGTRIVITPGLVELGDRELDFNRTLGEQAASCCHHLITVGESDRVDAIQKGAREGGLHRDSIHAAATVQQAMELARGLSGDDKMVLLLNDLTDNY
ncbi:MAG: UDP-N-acetylmuramoyl-tripeptide--D-alanyl-D-alanine ligase [Clostridia bacterium]|nr:UDP-N-acetylmuramoyl-tripeptide--D-alanyl-D-alanine ligase [Clostridia bacterium]